MIRASKETASEYRSGHVALLGRPNVGKSTLLNAFIGERIAIVSHHPQTTRDRLLGVRTDEDAQIAFVDTPGLHAPINKLGMRMNREAQEAIEGADVLVFVTEVGKLTRSDLSRTDIGIIKELPPNTPSICVLNKIDRLADKARLIPLLQSIPHLRNFSAIVPICAKSEDGVERLLEEVKSLLPKGPKLYDDDTLTDRSTRYLVAEFVREQILARTRAELPHGIAVTVTSYTEGEGKNKKAMPVVELTVHVPKESHKKMIIGKGGVVMKVVGTAARARIEELLGQRIMLKLWVRVTPRWFEDENAMRELGYGVGGST